MWNDDDAGFAAWCEGRTGYPFVDAAMRQLAATGWMHNRARMVVASFLTKDLGIDWRRGERFFLQRLVDGDPASNNGGWQWAASTGTDAQPYFRIFNPVTQGERFDPDGAYVRRFVPELRDVEPRFVQRPWDAPVAAARLSASDRRSRRATHPHAAALRSGAGRTRGAPNRVGRPASRARRFLEGTQFPIGMSTRPSRRMIVGVPPIPRTRLSAASMKPYLSRKACFTAS